MGRIAWGFGAWCIVVIAAAGVACGRRLADAEPPDVAAEPDAHVDPHSDADDAAEGDPDAREAESPISLFACGETRCIAGEQRCCTGAGVSACQTLDASCATSTDAGVDADADAGPSISLECTSYRNCPFNYSCCYTVNVGSKCKDRCASGELSLCELNRDGCSFYTSCRTFTGSPQPSTIGDCR